MIRGWPLTVGLLLVLVGASLAVPGEGGSPDGLGVPALLFPEEGRRAAPGDAAARAERRLEDFLSGASGADSLVLGEGEVGAVVRQRLRERLPAGVTDLRVELRGPTAAVSARIRFGELETGGEAAGRLSQFLGDSARVELELEPAVARAGSGRFTLLGLRAGGLTLPSRVLPFMLSRLGVESSGEEQPVVTVPIPRALAGIEVGDGRLVLTRSSGR